MISSVLRNKNQSLDSRPRGACRYSVAADEIGKRLMAQQSFDNWRDPRTCGPARYP